MGCCRRLSGELEPIRNGGVMRLWPCRSAQFGPCKRDGNPRGRGDAYNLFNSYIAPKGRATKGEASNALIPLVIPAQLPVEPYRPHLYLRLYPPDSNHPPPTTHGSQASIADPPTRKPQGTALRGHHIRRLMRERYVTQWPRCHRSQ